MLKQARTPCSPFSSVRAAQPSRPVSVRNTRQLAVRGSFGRSVNEGSQQQAELQQAQLQYTSAISRRTTFLQLTSSAALATAAFLLPWSPLSPAIPPATAAAGPQELEGDVKAAVVKALSKVVTKPKAPVILRLAYHDAGTFSAAAGNGGANASIQFELDRPENTGLKRGWKLIEQIQDNLKKTPAQGKLSNADLIAVAGAYAVQICGGPSIDVPIGRVDATAADPEGRMVSEKAGITALIDNFAEKGLGSKDLVVLSGAHTLGGKGFGDPVTFDNAYYTALLAKPWLNPNDNMASMIGLPSDHVLPDDPECLKYIQTYADDQELFFRDFAKAYAQLTSLGANWA